MAAAAEELAAGWEAATLPERDLEPPAWVTGEPDETPEPAPGESNGTITLSSAEFDDLRGLGMSVTQAKRVLRYREQRGGFTDLDELERVPGFPREFLAEIRDRVVS
jgi:DNA uptake protein ComE-like DNA-binding protein